MRLSCNGCRVLRKGCGDSCSIRPCLQWIKSPDAQSNATVFLAKFYGRAGLLNLVNAAPQHLRPAVFRSLLYEACGRIVNPIYGSVGLLWSGNWNMCQAAVEAVLKGAPIVKISSDEAAADTPSPAHLHKAAYDIRHVAASSPSDKPGRLKKRTSASSAATAAAATTTARSNKKSKKAAPDDDHQQQQVSTASDHHHLHVVEPMDSDDAEAAGSHVSQAEQSTHSEREAEQSIHNERESEQSIHDERESEQSTHDEQQVEEKPQEQMGLDLTLGFVPIPAPCVPRPAPDAGDAGCSITGTGWTAHEPAFRFLLSSQVFRN